MREDESALFQAQTDIEEPTARFELRGDRQILAFGDQRERGVFRAAVMRAGDGERGQRNIVG